MVFSLRWSRRPLARVVRLQAFLLACLRAGAYRKFETDMVLNTVMMHT